MNRLPLVFATVLSSANLNSQVYDVNAVGYVNKEILPGFSLISVPLARTDQVLFPTANLPHGFAIYFLRGHEFTIATFDATTSTFSGAELDPKDLEPGGGFFVLNPSSNAITTTFVGQVLQGRLTNQIPVGMSIQSSIVPQRGDLATLGYPVDPGDAVYVFDSVRQRYKIHVFDDLEFKWLPSPPRELQVGEAFLLRTLRAKEWVREFSVNQ